MNEAFAARKRLFGIAYRMLGSAGDAEDVVQSAYLRLQEHRDDAIRDPVGWLVTATTRLAIDRGRELARHRERYVGEWLPEPLVNSDPSDEAAQADDLAIGFLRVLERLRPEERSAMLLHDVFDYSHAEVARILGKSEEAVRQMATRARHRVLDERPRVAVDRRKAAQLTRRFLDALRDADVNAIRAVLATDVVHVADGGGVVASSVNPVIGADRVSRLLLGLRVKYWQDRILRPLSVNGLPGIGVYERESVRSIMAFDFTIERIAAIYQVVNPEKLRRAASGGTD